MHHPYRDFGSYLAKQQRYTDWSAYDPGRRRARPSVLGILARTVGIFLRTYVLQGGWLDGGHGLILCMATAFTTFATCTKRWGRLEPAPASDRAPAIDSSRAPRQRPSASVAGD
jgi:hypothetical protein